MTRVRWLESLSGWVRDVVFPLPPACLWCGLPSPDAACAACRRSLLPAPDPAAGTDACCRRCGRRLPRQRAGEVARCTSTRAVAARRCDGCRVLPPALQAVTALGVYRGSLRWTIRRIKRYGELALLDPLAAALARELYAAGRAVDLIVPVPSDRGRLRRRGVDPVHALAERLADQLRRLCYDVLARRSGLPPQQALRGQARRRNLIGAFHIKRGMDALLRGRAVLLVDDVLTTGATLQAAGLALLAAGARQVWPAVLAERREPAA